MTSKKIIGYLFITIASISTLAILALTPKFISSLVSILKKNQESYQIGYHLGHISFFIIYIIITIILWYYGKRFVKTPKA